MLDPLETILRQCAEAAPDPWYPSEYSRTTCIEREQLDPHLDELRMAGLIHLTDWVQGRGQGYALTPEGEYALQHPRELARLQAGQRIPARPMPQEPPNGPGERLTHFERGEQIRAAFLHPSPPVVSFTLIFLNVAWFVPELLLSLRYQLPLNEFLVGYTQNRAHQIALNQVLSEAGGLLGAYLVQGEWWRLLSCCFVHGGLLHLGVNMWVLYVVGPVFEQLWGRSRFLVLYLIAGLGGSCTMAIVNPMILGVGASGAIWGIITGHAAWILLNRRYLPPALASQMLRRILFVLIINAGISFLPGISAAAHFGGGAVGVVAALLLHAHRYGHSFQRGFALLGLVALPVLCVGAVAAAERIDPRWQELLLLQTEQEADQLLDAKVRPLFRQKLKAYSLQEVQDAVADLRQARALCFKVAKQLGAAGPIQPKAWREQSQAHLHDLEQKVEQYEEAELEVFIGPLAADAHRQAVRVYQEEHEALQKLDENQRTAAVEEQAIDRCRQARHQVEAVIQILRDAGPYRNPKLDKKRVTWLDDLAEAVRGWERTEQRMRKTAKSTA